MRLIRSAFLAAALFLAPLITACATMPAPSASIASLRPALVRAEAAYVRIGRVAMVLLPLLPPERADRVRAAQAVVERALALARVAVTAAELRAAIGAAEAGTAALVDAAGA